MKNNDYIDDELKDAPLLKSMSGETPFRAPAGYFDSLPTLISEKISAQNSKPWWSIFIQNIFQPKYVVAACVFGVAVISGVVYFNQPENIKDIEIILSYEDVSNSAYMDDLDESLLVEELSKYDNTSYDEQSKDIENYLIDSQTDISLIENEL